MAKFSAVINGQNFGEDNGILLIVMKKLSLTIQEENDNYRENYAL